MEIDIEKLRIEMARANIKPSALAERANVHRNTIGNILRGETATLETLAAVTASLNAVLRERGHAEIGPLGLLKAEKEIFCTVGQS